MSATHFYGAAFFGGEFFFGAAPVVIEDTHDDVRRRIDAKREAKERLREQIRFALEGPLPEPMQEAIAPYVAPQQTDALLRPVIERVDLERIVAEVEAAQRVYEAYQRALDDDEDDVIALLTVH